MLRLFLILVIFSASLHARVDISDVELVNTDDILQSLLANNGENISDYLELSAFWTNQSKSAISDDHLELSNFQINLKAV